MKGINTPGQALDERGFASLPPQRARYFTLRSLHSLGRATSKLIPFPSLRLEMKGIVSILVVLLLASLPLSAFDGFTDIFGPTDEVAVTGTSQETPFDPSLGINGSVGFSIEGMRALDNTREIETAIGGGLEIDLAWKGSIVDAQAKLALKPTIDTPLQWIDIFKGLSITSYFNGGRLEAGLLKKEWGAGDGVHVVDVLNAPDYRNGIVDDSLAMKVAEPMVLTTANWNNTALEVVYKPLLVPMLVAEDPAHRWSMLTEGQATLFSTATVNQTTSAELSRFANGQYGGRLVGTFGPADLGLIYYNGFYTMPAYDVRAYYSSGGAIDIGFTRAQLFATEATVVTGVFTFMFEGGFWLSEDASATEPETYNSKWVYLGAVGIRIPGTGAYASITCHGQYILGFDETNPIDVDTMQANQSSDGKAYMNTLTAAVDIPLARERVTVRLAGTYQIETKGYALLPSVMYSISDDLVLKVAGRLFGAVGDAPDSLFKTWAANDSLAVGITYLF